MDKSNDAYCYIKTTIKGINLKMMEVFFIKKDFEP